MDPALYVVATPIGNLEDMTGRAVKILSSVDHLCVEDSRVSGRLLAAHDIGKPHLITYHDHNKERVTPTVLDHLERGESVAVISDAGTPGIADPAFYLVRAAVARGVRVIPLPGPCALVAALVCSGLPCDRFVFENFLPPRKGKRRTRLQTLREEERTVIFYESPYRIVAVLEDIDAVLGDVRVVLARELTKLHEEFLRGTPRELIAHFEQRKPKGEFVVMLSGKKRTRFLSNLSNTLSTG